ncbi:RR1 [Spodoptera litura nucleopolyhedrovirus II]|uniref:RR1 n=1 Tax=Spodoptera litura nucleopolyhedrovirus II TaxID=566270 RepID=UPI0001874664|nr:RR1 [Spodoptera litura nucleopolyhedrovirus II]ACI47514.1 RR1 [Spodoptera litura nucleopolyhedrovirus II]
MEQLLDMASTTTATNTLTYDDISDNETIWNTFEQIVAGEEVVYTNDDAENRVFENNYDDDDDSNKVFENDDSSDVSLQQSEDSDDSQDLDEDRRVKDQLNKIKLVEFVSERAVKVSKAWIENDPRYYIMDKFECVEEFNRNPYKTNLSKLDNLTILLNNLSGKDIDTRYVDVPKLMQKIKESINENGVSFEQMKLYCADVAASMTYIHYDYALLAGRILVEDLHNKVCPCFVEVTNYLAQNNVVSHEFNNLVVKHGALLNREIKHNRDYDYKYFGFKTLTNGYLLKVNDVIAERPQHMLMRVALAIHGDDVMSAIETYQLMSLGTFTHASPTLFAAGTCRPQMCSCFLQCIKEDSIDGIYKTLHESALISNLGGGLGLSVQSVSAQYNGTTKSGGLVSMLRVFNNMVRHVDQGGKRKGALAAYVEPWHPEIYDVLNLRRNMGSEDAKARDLMLGLWIPDLFMERVKENKEWSLFCPKKYPGLLDEYGSSFEILYEKYEKNKLYERQVKARDLFRFIVETNVETGGPYMLYKDPCNKFSNQKNLGIIKCSNLCAEIVQYCDKDETAVCNLASIAVNKCVNVKTKTFDYVLLNRLTKIVVRNLNKIIDSNHYPTAGAANSNKKHRPVGVGIQGLADAFVLLDIPYDSEEARSVNYMIAETIYFSALEASCELAKIDGPYESYENSPLFRGTMHYDNYNIYPTDHLWNWSKLREKIQRHGVRNSLLVAYMPTATTAQILGNNESFEPFTSNVYLRRVLAGEFQVVNQYLIKALVDLNIYTPELRNKILAENGSVQNIDEIPQHVKDLFKTAWEIKSKCMIDMAADRAPFIDQSQSLNLFVAEPTYSVMSSIHFYTWQKQLKTGMYYLRTKPAAQATQFTVDAEAAASCGKKRKMDDDGTEECMSCHA